MPTLPQQPLSNEETEWSKYGIAFCRGVSICVAFKINVSLNIRTTQFLFLLAGTFYTHLFTRRF